MTAQTSLQQRQAQPNIHEAHPATLTTTENITQHDGHFTERDAAMSEEHAKKLPVPSATGYTPSTAVLVCAAILVVSALFAAGFMRPQLGRALRRLLESVEDMDVPLMLPVYIAEAARELLVDRRMVAKRPGQANASAPGRP